MSGPDRKMYLAFGAKHGGRAPGSLTAKQQHRKCRGNAESRPPPISWAGAVQRPTQMVLLRQGLWGDPGPQPLTLVSMLAVPGRPCPSLSALPTPVIK